LDEIFIHRLRIGHTYLTHRHLLRGDAPPRCLACQVGLTVEHFLLHCVSFTSARDNCFCVTLTSMSEFFSKVASRSIIDLLKKLDFIIKFILGTKGLNSADVPLSNKQTNNRKI